MKAIILNNRAEFELIEQDVFSHYKSKFGNDINTTKWDVGTDSLDGSGQVLMTVDERVLDYPFTQEVIEIESTDAKWFNQEIL